MNNVPEIRFNEFSAFWEEKKLAAFCTESRIFGHTGNEAKKITVKLWGKGIIEKNEMGSENTKYFFRKAGQIIYSQLDFLNSAFAIIPDEFDGYETTQDLPAFDVSNMNPYFLFYRVIQESFYQKKGNVANGSRKAKRIHAEDFLEMKIFSTKIDEQNLIANFFNNITNLITSTQEKLEKTIILKKSMLEKMFPKDGAKVPELRFKEFKEEYETISTSKIFEVVNDRNHPELPVLSASQEYGMVYRNETGGSNIAYNINNQDTYKRILPGQFAIHLRSFQGGFAHSDKDGICSPAYTIMKFIEINKHDEYYWKYLLTSDRFIKRLEIITYGIRDGRSISFEDFSTFNFNLPNKEEQKKIGVFFTQLDSTISSYKDELEKLKTIKKSLLQKMFV